MESGPWYKNELWLSYAMKWKSAIWPWKIFSQSPIFERDLTHLCTMKIISGSIFRAFPVKMISDGWAQFFFYLRLPSQLNYAGPLSLPNPIMPDPPSPPNWIMPDHLIQIRYNIPPPPIELNFCTPQLIFFVPLPIEFFFFQTDTKNCLGEKSIPPTPNASQSQWRVCISRKNLHLEHPALLYIQCYGVYSWVSCFPAKKMAATMKLTQWMKFESLLLHFYTIQMPKCVCLTRNWIMMGWGTINTW